MIKRSRLSRMMLVLICFIWTMPLALQEARGEEPKLLKDQTIYLPIYSNIMVGEKKKISFNLSVNVSIRNTDPNHPITILTADYYNSEGKLVRRYIESPKTLAPMASSYHYIAQSDAAGGWGPRVRGTPVRFWEARGIPTQWLA